MSDEELDKRYLDLLGAVMTTQYWDLDPWLERELERIGTEVVRRHRRSRLEDGCVCSWCCDLMANPF